MLYRQDLHHVKNLKNKWPISRNVGQAMLLKGLRNLQAEKKPQAVKLSE